MTEKSILVSAATVLDTLRITMGTLSDSVRRKLTEEGSNDRLTWWSHRVVGRAGARVRVQGLGHREAGRAYVIMSNHLSHFDIPILYYALGANMRMVAKKELFAIPLFGPAMRESGFIEVDRGDHKRAVESLDHAKEAIARGMSIWIAPEGTRSTTGALGRFKKGGFLVAQKTGAPILPVTIRGTRDILPTHARVMTIGRDVDVIVHPAIEIDPNDATPATREALVARVRAVIESAL